SVTTLVLVWYGLTYSRRELAPLCWWLAIAAVPPIAAAMFPYNQVWAWTSYHLLVAGWLAIGASAGAVACVQQRANVALGTCLAMLSLVIGLTLMTGWRDPISWCPVALLGGAILVICALGLYRRHHAYSYVSVPLALLLSTQAFVQFVPSRQWDAVDFISINLLASIAICAWWLAVEIYRERTAATTLPRWQMPVPLTITPIVTVIYSLFITLSLLLSNSFWNNAFWALRTPSLVVTAALGSYLFAMLWYNRQRLALPCLYVWGLMVSLTLSEAFPKHWHLGDVALPALAAVYILITGLLWQFGGVLAHYGQTLRIHEPVAGLQQTSRWLPTVTLGLGSIILLCDFGLVLVEATRTARLIAGFGPVLLALTVAMLAQQRRRELMIYLSLCFATVAAILLAWADLPPHSDALTWLRRLIRVLVVLGSLAFLYAIVLPRVWSHLVDWVAAVRRMSLTSAIGAGVSICVILVLEAQQFFIGHASQLSHAEVGIVAGVLLLLVAALISMAVSKREAWGDEQARMAYVYAAQLVLALAFGHMYLTRPDWFDGLLRPYWPYIVMAIAFGGVGLSEWFARLKLRVLSEPFIRTGMFLPLLPAIGWWVEASQGKPSTDYALVMFVVGMLYVVVSLMRQSLVSAMFAGVAGNVALWSLMYERDVRLIEHPQFWLIPPAISVLAAAQLNQHRLSHAQLTATRYFCMIVVYLSSTSEVFLRVESFWPPLILAALAVVGVFVGIALQIRAFLYLGTSFVFLAMMTMVWHASLRYGQWPWWVFGICVGLAMLVLFGLFEKKRTEITLLIERLRQWEK
ncbi:MAG TPA: hypothetical protein VL096_03840, partial [Pirellulaceae bacterium]|nr:hypothetical protein [Pirellulaceae bacterium]